MYKPEIAEKWGLSEDSRRKTGLLAQELREIMPDAVHDIGDYLTVDENRVFYETLLATQELCRLTGDLDSKIDEKVDEISQRLARYARRKKLTASIASNLSGETCGDNRSMLSYSRSSLASSYAPRERGKRDRRSNCRTSCHRPDPLCSSKLTQGTIITLVVVMAFCLISMTALYVLDWHNRNYGPNVIPSLPRNYTDSIPGEMRDMGILGQLPILQPDAPPLAGVCRSRNCHHYCCADKNEYHTEKKEKALDHIVMMTGGHRKLMTRSAPGLENGQGKPFPSGVVISVPVFNMTLDTRYCIEDSCSKKLKIYNLYIPVSPYLPTIPLEITFT